MPKVILNLPILDITRQYMEYVDVMKDLKLELEGNLAQFVSKFLTCIQNLKETESMIQNDNATLQGFLAHAIADFQGIDDIRKEIFRNLVKAIDECMKRQTESSTQTQL